MKQPRYLEVSLKENETTMRSMLRSHAVAAFLTLGTLALLVPASSQSQQTSASPVHTGAAMPDSRFYSLVFRHLLYLQTNGDPAPVAGALSPSITNFYSGRIRANANENASLLSEAEAWKAEVDPIDSQAHALIVAIRTKTPGGRLAPGEQPPPVPQQLIDLQTKRDNITLKHVANLKLKFGDARFAQIDNGIHRAMHASLKGPRPFGPATRSEGQ
jgi:hypothetical protein